MTWVSSCPDVLTLLVNRYISSDIIIPLLLYRQWGRFNSLYIPKGHWNKYLVYCDTLYKSYIFQISDASRYSILYAYLYQQKNVLSGSWKRHLKRSWFFATLADHSCHVKAYAHRRTISSRVKGVNAWCDLCRIRQVIQSISDDDDSDLGCGHRLVYESTMTVYQILDS